MNYNGFISQNTAYPDSRRIGLYDRYGNRVGIAPLGPLAYPETGAKQYSFGALSDVHISYSTAEADFRRSLTFLRNEENVSFTCICGDLTGSGTEEELARYKTVVDEYSPDVPVYAIAGNHEFYSTVSNGYLENYTGHPLYYSLERGDDVFIMCGCYSTASDGVFTQEYLQWLYETLEANRNRRCFVFEHFFPPDDSGNACGVYDWSLGTGTKSSVFLSLMKHYKNTVLFHGHSHLLFYLQEKDPRANYSSEQGYRSVHIPSVAVPRDIVDGVMTDITGGSQGYVVDVYENGIHLRGRDFVEEEFLPVASYWIDTTLQTVVEGSYIDPTGTVVTGEYTQLDYIEATGTQYIDTEFIPNQDSRIVCEFMYLGGTGIYGARSTVSSRNFSMRVISGAWQLGYGNGVTTGTIASDENWHVADQNKNSLYIDGELAASRDYVTFSAPYPAAIGAIIGGSIYYGQGRYRSCQIYDGDDLILDLVAARFRDGRVGMYDRLNGVFYGNAGTGEFFAGPVL